MVFITRRACLFLLALAFFSLLSVNQALPTSPPHEVWIAFREDGYLGTGTQEDPYDGSTQARFDAVMNGISENTTIHLGPGIFETHGGMVWHPRNNWTISGAGIDATILLQTAIYPGQFQVIAGAYIRNLTVSDLTVDCNYINLSPTLNDPRKAIGAICAVDGYFHDIKVIHAGGMIETFTLGFALWGVGSIPPSSVLIENCRVEQSGPKVTAIYASNSQTDNNSDTFPGAGLATIRNCYVEGTGDPITGGIGFQVNGYQSAVIDNCSTVGCSYAIYRDTLPQAGVTIKNSNISGVVNAIGLVGALADNVLIENNTLSGGDIIVRTDGATNVTIRNNAFYPSSPYNNWWRPLQTTCSTSIINNRFDPAITNGSRIATPGWMSGNRYFDDSIVSFLPDSTSVSSAPTDFNNDIKPDLVLYKSSTRQTAIWYMNSNVQTGTAYGPTLPSGWTLAGSADFDGDGHADYALFNPSSHRTSIWYLSGATYRGNAAGPTPPGNWQLVGVADFNLDGKPDYLLCNSSTRQTAIWYLNNNSFVSSKYGPTVAAGWQLVGASDFNGDRNPDFVLFKSSTRRSAIWYLCGCGLTTKAYGPTIASGYSLMGTADFNSDGYPDYMLCKTSNRHTAVWYMNNNSYRSGANGPTLASGWSMVVP